VATSPDKIQAVLNWPVPVNVKGLRSFLGWQGIIENLLAILGS
jgi:hypothetical protein